MDRKAHLIIAVCLILCLIVGVTMYIKLSNAMTDIKAKVVTLTEAIAAKDAEIASLTEKNLQLESDAADLRAQLDAIADASVSDAQKLEDVLAGRFNNTKRFILKLNESGKYEYEYLVQEYPFDEDVVNVHVTGTTAYGSSLDYTVRVSFTENSNTVHFEIFRLLDFSPDSYNGIYSACNDCNAHYDWITVSVDPIIDSINVEHDEAVSDNADEGDALNYALEQIISSVGEIYDGFRPFIQK